MSEVISDAIPASLDATWDVALHSLSSINASLIFVTRYFQSRFRSLGFRKLLGAARRV
jgi:hypothetical protein